MLLVPIVVQSFFRAYIKYAIHNPRLLRVLDRVIWGGVLYYVIYFEMSVYRFILMPRKVNFYVDRSLAIKRANEESKSVAEFSTTMAVPFLTIFRLNFLFGRSSLLL